MDCSPRGSTYIDLVISAAACSLSERVSNPNIYREVFRGGA